jgi:hypothetical protein
MFGRRALVPVRLRQRKQMGLAVTSVSQVMRGELPLDPHEGTSALAVTRGVGQYFT